MDLKNKVFKDITLIFALFTIVILFAILAFILVSSLPVLQENNLFDIIFGTKYSPTSKNPSFGLFPMLLTTIITTVVAIIFSAIIGFLVAIYISKLAPSFIRKALILINDIMVGVPSIIFGFFALKLIVPIIYTSKFNSDGGPGNSLLAAIIVISIMFIPTIISISITALDQVEPKYSLASYALGANKIQTIFKVDFLMAKSGLLVAIILGVSRALGETMAVMLVAGNVVNMPNSLFTPVRTLTSNIATEINYAAGVHQSVLFLTCVLLFAFIIALNVIIFLVNKKGRTKNAR